MKEIVITGAPWIDRLTEALHQADSETVIVVDNESLRGMALDAAGILDKDIIVKVKETTMVPNEIIALIDAYRDLLHQELATKTIAEKMKVIILGSTVIDGKNAETRKRQAEQALAESEAYQIAIREAADNEISRKTIEAEISLTKAWLYSQSGH
jgi:hypothetical protein